MPTPRLYVTHVAGDIDLTPAQAVRLVADDIIYLCSLCDEGVYHVNNSDNDRLKDALATLGNTPTPRVFVPISSAWN